jgi:hypothetical protein
MVLQYHDLWAEFDAVPVSTYAVALSSDEVTSHWLVRRISSGVSESINLYIATV